MRLPDENDLAVGGGGRRPGGRSGKAVSRWAENSWREFYSLRWLGTEAVCVFFECHAVIKNYIGQKASRNCNQTLKMNWTNSMRKVMGRASHQ